MAMGGRMGIQADHLTKLTDFNSILAGNLIQDEF